jgi:hypothetical protein
LCIELSLTRLETMLQLLHIAGALIERRYRKDSQTG